MCSKLVDAFIGRIKTTLMDFCPCLMQNRQSCHELDDLRKSTFRGQERTKENGMKEKIFTIETMKKVAPIKKKGSEKLPVQGMDDCLVLEKCPWDTESSDLFLRVGKSLFLVHQFLLSIESEILKTIIESVPAVKDITTMVTLNGYEADEIKMLLTFVYLPESEINDENILTLLRLAEELMVEELVIRCEDFLLASDHFSPITLLNLASKYQLPSLEESAAIKASKIPGIENKEQFDTLSEKQKQKVLQMAKNRYRSSARFVEKFDAGSSKDGRLSNSPDIKLERKLHQREDDFQGRLSFLPERETSETAPEETET